MKFNPIDLIKSFNISFSVVDLELKIDADNWPSNLIYDDTLDQENSDESFHETFWSDTTMTFIVESAIKRVRSLVSRATHNQDSLWHHSDIFVIFHEDDPQDFDQPHYMTRSTVIVYIKENKK